MEVEKQMIKFQNRNKKVPNINIVIIYWDIKFDYDS